MLIASRVFFKDFSVFFGTLVLHNTSQWLLGYFISIFHFSRFFTTAFVLSISKFTDQVENALTFLFKKYFNPSILAQSTITRSKSTIETLQQGVKFVQS